MKVVFSICFATVYLSFLSSCATTPASDRDSPLTLYDLQKSPARDFLEYVAQLHGDQTTGNIKVLKLTPTTDGFEYDMELYAGEGLHERKGKLDKKGRLKEREMRFEYCDHGEVDPNKCFLLNLQQTLNPKTGRALTTKGVYRESKNGEKKPILEIKIKDLASLKKAENMENENKSLLKTYFEKPVPQSFLKAYSYSE